MREIEREKMREWEKTFPKDVAYIDKHTSFLREQTERQKDKEGRGRKRNVKRKREIKVFRFSVANLPLRYKICVKFAYSDKHTSLMIERQRYIYTYKEREV
jgi:hypothetical protein